MPLPHAGADGARARPARREAVLRGFGFGLAVALGAVAVWLIVTSTSQKRIELGILAGLWGLLLGAFAAFGSRRLPRVGEPGEPTQVLALRARTEMERADESAARLRFEARLEQMLRQELQTTFGREIAALRDEVASLRNDLLEKVGGQLRLERIETTRVIGSDIEALYREIDQLKHGADPRTAHAMPASMQPANVQPGPSEWPVIVPDRAAAALSAAPGQSRPQPTPQGQHDRQPTAQPLSYPAAPGQYDLDLVPASTPADATAPRRSEPAADQPATGQLATGRLATGQPATGQPAAIEPVTAPMPAVRPEPVAPRPAPPDGPRATPPEPPAPEWLPPTPVAASEPMPPRPSPTNGRREGPAGGLVLPPAGADGDPFANLPRLSPFPDLPGLSPIGDDDAAEPALALAASPGPEKSREAPAVHRPDLHHPSAGRHGTPEPDPTRAGGRRRRAPDAEDNVLARILARESSDS